MPMTSKTARIVWIMNDQTSFYQEVKDKLGVSTINLPNGMTLYYSYVGNQTSDFRSVLLYSSADLNKPKAGSDLMDKLEEAVDQMSKMPEEQRNNLIEIEKKRVCICRRCVSYSECMKGSNEGLFCILGKSSCKINVDNCICTECPAHQSFNLKNDFYCTVGSEMDLRG